MSEKNIDDLMKNEEFQTLLQDFKTVAQKDYKRLRTRFGFSHEEATQFMQNDLDRLFKEFDKKNEKVPETS